MEGLWCGKVPDGVSQEEPLSKLQIKGAHDRDQQVQWQRMLAENTETFNTQRFEDAAVLAARASGDHEIEALICKGLAAAYSGLGLYDKMLEYEQQALNIAKQTGDVEGEGRAYCRLANIYRNLKNPDQSIVCLENALAIAQRIGDGDTEHECYCTLSVNCSGKGNFVQGITYGEKALQRAMLQGNTEREGSACGCLGIAYSCKGEHAKAVKWHEKYLLAAKKTQNKGQEAQARGYLGAAHLSLHNLLSALEHFEQYFGVAVEVEDLEMQGRALVCCAQTHMRLRQSRSCLRAVIGAVKLGKDIPSLALLEQVKELLEPVRKLVVEEATDSTRHPRGSEATDSTSHRAASSAADELQPCLEHVELLLVLVESVGSDEMVTSTHNLLRTLYITIGNKNKAQEHCRAALTHARARDDKVQVAIQNEVKGLLEVGGGGARGDGGWDKSFKALILGCVAEATANAALVHTTPLLPTVAGDVVGKVWAHGGREADGAGGGEADGAGDGCLHIIKAVRILKVRSGVKVGLKQTELKVGRAWKEQGSIGKVWFVALDWVAKDVEEVGESHASAGFVEVTVCNGSEMLHSEVPTAEALVKAAEAVFVGNHTSNASDKSTLVLAGGGKGGADRANVWQQPLDEAVVIDAADALVVNVWMDMAVGAVAFTLNGKKMGSSITGITGELVLAVQMSSQGDRVEEVGVEHGSAHAPVAHAHVSRHVSTFHSIDERVRILGEMGKVAFKSHDFRDAVQVFSLALKLAPDSHVLFSNRSAAHLALGQFDKAMEDGERAVRLKGDCAKGFMRKGDALAAGRRLHEAVAVYKLGLSRDSTCSELQDRIATAEQQLEVVEREEREKKEKRTSQDEKKKEDTAADTAERYRERIRVKQARHREHRKQQAAAHQLSLNKLTNGSGVGGGGAGVLGEVELGEVEGRPRSILEGRPRSISLIDKPFREQEEEEVAVSGLEAWAFRGVRSLSLGSCLQGQQDIDGIYAEEDVKAAAQAAAATSESAAAREPQKKEAKMGSGGSEAAAAKRPAGDEGERPAGEEVRHMPPPVREEAQPGRVLSEARQSRGTRRDEAGENGGTRTGENGGTRTLPQDTTDEHAAWSFGVRIGNQRARRRNKPQPPTPLLPSPPTPPSHTKTLASSHAPTLPARTAAVAARTPAQPPPAAAAPCRVSMCSSRCDETGHDAHRPPDTPAATQAPNKAGEVRGSEVRGGALNAAPVHRETGSMRLAETASMRVEGASKSKEGGRKSREGGRRTSLSPPIPSVRRRSCSLSPPRAIHSNEGARRRNEAGAPEEVRRSTEGACTSLLPPCTPILPGAPPMAIAIHTTANATKNIKDIEAAGGYGHRHGQGGQGKNEEARVEDGGGGDVRPQVRRWKPRSRRWREQLCQLAALPDEQVRFLGDLIFSADVSTDRTYHIDHGAKGTLVFVGLHKNGTECAIKRMQRVQTWRNMMQEEIAALNHAGLDRCPHVVAYEADAQDHNFEYLALQLCECNLEEHIKEQVELHGALGEDLVQRYARDILEGLAWLARVNQVHRDIKPRNLLLDQRGQLLLADFGLVREMGCDASSVHSGEAGTMGWMATEVLASVASGHHGRWKTKSDVQVAGMVMFYMLTAGRHPFGDNAITTQFNILQGKPANLHLVADKPLAHDLIDWLLTCDVESRPSAQHALETHPYFWTLSDGRMDAEKSANFISKIAMTSQCRHPEQHADWQAIDTDLCKELFGPSGDWVVAAALNSRIVSSKQKFQAHKQAEGGKEYKTTSICHFLRLFRNIMMHHTPEDRAAMGKDRSVAEYLASRDWFPALVARIYKIVRTSDLRNHPDLASFCRAPP